MKKITALILLFVYLGYITGILQNGYHAKEHGQCPDLFAVHEKYVKSPVEASANTFYVENCASNFLSSHFHIAPAGDVKFVRLQYCLSHLVSVLTRPPDCISNIPLFNAARQSLYSSRVFLKNCVLRL